MVRYERLVNNAQTTLSSTITDSVTSIGVADGSVFPSEGDFRLVVNEELMLCTARSTNTLTVTRGIEGTTAAAHSSGDDIAAIITQGGMDQFTKDFLDPMAFSRQHRLIDASGNVLTSSSFTQGNFGTSSVTDESDGTITISMEDRAGPNLVALYKTAPSTPYTLSAHILTGVGHNASNENASVIGFRESSSNKISHISYHYFNSSFTQYLEDFNDDTGSPANSSQEPCPPRQDYWLRIEDDGTNLTYYRSADGYNWWEQHTELRGFHFDTGPDQILWGGDNQGDDGEMIHLLAWIEE